MQNKLTGNNLIYCMQLLQKNKQRCVFHRICCFDTNHLTAVIQVNWSLLIAIFILSHDWCKISVLSDALSDTNPEMTDWTRLHSFLIH